jgi:catechol 2,3-dioxygenase-like lactoylglutathione lyase family enzyme
LSEDSDLPIIGIAGITFKISDLPKARWFYEGVLGLSEAFQVENALGATSTYFKVNDDQYIEVIETLMPGELVRQMRVVFQSSDIERLHATYRKRALRLRNIHIGRDANPMFSVTDPEGNRLDFIEYVSASRQAQARGKFLSPNRVSKRISHVGLMIRRPATTRTFYEQKLGFPKGRLPGDGSQYIEPMRGDLNVETKNPPLDPNDPSVYDQYVREQYGAIQHVCLEVSDMRSARDTVQARGGYDDLRVRAHVGNIRRWLVHLFDPDGSRTELMETALQTTLPPMTVMAPGTPAQPILPKTPGILSWP